MNLPLNYNFKPNTADRTHIDRGSKQRMTPIVWDRDARAIENIFENLAEINVTHQKEIAPALKIKSDKITFIIAH